jgi:predicted PurR-regulated permease PerM
VATASSPTTPLWILAVVGVALFLREARDLFLPIALSLLLAFALAPVVRLLQRTRMNRWVAVTLVMGSLCAAALLGAYQLADNAAQAMRELPQTLRQVRQRMEQGGGGSFIERMNRAADEMRKMQPGSAQQPSPPPAPPAGGGFGIGQALSSGSAIAGNLVVILFLTFFLLATAASYRDRIVQLLKPHLTGSREAAGLLDEITSQVERFVVVRILTSAIVGVATWIALLLMGAPQPAMWGALAGVFNSIPYFGPIIVSGGLFLVGVLAGGVRLGIELGTVALVITSLEGWLITPPLMGKAERMHTLAIFVGLLVWTWIWGIWGTILAVPLLAVMKAVADHLPPLRPLSLLLKE